MLKTSYFWTKSWKQKILEHSPKLLDLLLTITGAGFDQWGSETTGEENKHTYYTCVIVIIQFGTRQMIDWSDRFFFTFVKGVLPNVVKKYAANTGTKVAKIQA